MGILLFLSKLIIVILTAIIGSKLALNRFTYEKYWSLKMEANQEILSNIGLFMDQVNFAIGRLENKKKQSCSDTIEAIAQHLDENTKEVHEITNVIRSMFHILNYKIFFASPELIEAYNNFITALKNTPKPAHLEKNRPDMSAWSYEEKEDFLFKTHHEVLNNDIDFYKTLLEVADYHLPEITCIIYDEIKKDKASAYLKLNIFENPFKSNPH